MNKRFRKLAEQARAEEYSGWLGGKPATTVTYDELERFAQLIVGECADIVASRPYIDDGNWPHPSTMIRKHFGVEQ